MTVTTAAREPVLADLIDGGLARDAALVVGSAALVGHSRRDEDRVRYRRR